MPTSAVVTALVAERTLCVACITETSGLTSKAVEALLDTIAAFVVIRRDQHRRCCRCGWVGAVCSIGRP